MPPAAGSKARWNGSSSSSARASTLSSQWTDSVRCGALRGSRTHAATASTSRPASTGADQALTAYSRPIVSAVASASATTRRRGAIAGPSSATWTTRRQRQQRHRQREEVGVEVADEEGEPRELVDRVRHDARRLEPRVVDQRRRLREQQPRSLQVPRHDDERHRSQSRRDGAARPARDAPQRARQRERRARGERHHGGQREVVAARGLHAPSASRARPWPGGRGSSS